MVSALLEHIGPLLAVAGLGSAAAVAEGTPLSHIERRLSRHLGRGSIRKAVRLFRKQCEERHDEARSLLPTVLFGICRDAVADRNPNVRSLGTTAMGKLGVPEAVPILRDLLRDEVPVVRMCAEEALSQFKEPALVADLAKQLQGYDHYVKTRAAWALGKISFRPTQVTPYKGRLGSETQVLAAGPQVSTSGKSEAGLEEIRAEFDSHLFYTEIEATAISGAPSGPEEVPKEKRVYYLLTRGRAAEGTVDERVYELKGDQMVIGRLEDCDIYFRDQATSRHHAIVSIDGNTFSVVDNNSRNGVYVNGERITAPTILKENDILRVGENDLLVAGVRRDCSIILLLQEALQDDDPYFRNSATWALGEIGGQLATSTVSAALRDRSNIVRKNAAEALGKIRAAASVPALEQILLTDVDRFVRKNAAESLGGIGDPSCVAILERALLEDTDRFVRRNAAEALGQIADPSCVPTLEMALLDPSQFVQEGVLHALAALECAGAFPKIKGLLDSSSISVRIAAIEASGRIQDRAAQELLTEVLEDDDLHLKISAGRMLASADLRRYQAITRALEDEDSFIRLRAVEVLPEIGHPDEVRLIEKALADPIVGVRVKSVQALSRLGGDASTCQRVLGALEDENPEVRLHAVIDLCDRMHADSAFLSPEPQAS